MPPKRIDGLSEPPAKLVEIPVLVAGPKLEGHPRGDSPTPTPAAKKPGFTKQVFFGGGRMVLELTVASLLIFAALSMPSYLSRLQGKLAGTTLAAWLGNKAPAALTVPISNRSALDPFAISPNTSPAAVAATPAATSKMVAEFGDDELNIPSLNIVAPITFGVSLDDSLAKLKEGVVQMETSKRPGENGSIFIVGHSSSLPWDKNEFGQIFAKLPDIKDGAEILVRYQGQRYKYTVASRKTVKPDEITLPASNQLVLMTCVPVGTSQNRLLVFATPS